MGWKQRGICGELFLRKPEDELAGAGHGTGGAEIIWVTINIDRGLAWAELSVGVKRQW